MVNIIDMVARTVIIIAFTLSAMAATNLIF